MAKGDKTLRVRGTDVSHRSFLWVPDKNKTTSWLLPVYDPTSVEKTKRLIEWSLSRFDDVKSLIPMEEHRKLRLQLMGAAQSYGLEQTPATVEMTDDEMSLLLEGRLTSRLFADIDEDYD
jgi:hypothetical protein